MTDRPTPDDLILLNRASTVSRLLAGVVHEVNNALLVIGGSAELLQEQPAPPEMVVTRADRIRGQAARAGESIAAVLALARADLAARGRVELLGVVATAASLRAYAIGRAGLTLAVEAEDNAALTVHGNQPLLLQAVLNLVANAETALAGRPKGAIRVDIRREGDHALLRTADSGPGVPADDREHIFEPFVSRSGAAGAAGLGLAAARRIAELHGGTLSLEDARDGAVFVMRLPLEPTGAGEGRPMP